MANPAAVVAPYASEIVSSFDIWKPEKLNTLFRAKGDQGMSYFMLLKSMGFDIPTAQDEYSHFEDRFIHETFHCNAGQAAGAANATVTIRLAAVDLDAGNRYYPRLWDTVMFNDGITTASITAISAAGANVDIDVTPSVLGTNIPATLQDEEIVIISNAFSEGSTQPKGRISGATEYFNNTQIIKETMTATGTEMTNQDWFDQISEPGSGKILGYYMKGQLDVDYRMALAASNALLFQQKTTNTNGALTDAATGRPIVTTEGLIPYMRRVSQQQQVTPGNFSVLDFDAINKKLDKEFSGSDMVCLLGIDLHLDVDNALVNYFLHTDISYVTETVFGGDGKLAASVNFKALNKGDRNFFFKRMGQFSHPKIGGAAGYDFSKMGLVLPMGNKKDPVNGTSVPSFGCRYKKLGAYNRQMEVWNVSGAGPGQKVIAEDLHNHYMRCHIGAHQIAGNRFVLLEP